MGNRRWSFADKQRAVERMKSCHHEELAEELGIHKRQLYAWRMEVRRKLGLLPKVAGEQKLEQENRQLREALARKVLEVDFLQGALRRIEARRQASDGCGETASTKKSDT